MKFSIMNLGCKVNAFEAEAIASELEKRGWERTDFSNPADATLIFTCAVTNMAAQKSRKMMHRARRLNPDTTIVMVGCYVQVDDGQLEDADLLIGTAHKQEIPDLLEQYQKNHAKIHLIDDLTGLQFQNLQSDQYENHARAYLKIQDGCNQFCTYCVIPFARGRERSMHPDLVIQDAKRISKNYKEIVLTGIHTGRYGREYGVTLADLMERILKEVPDLFRLRISSIEITELDDRLLELFKNEPRIAKHLHIPLQAGSDTVLERMHRPYNTEKYYAKIESIRKEIPDISISCDLITGFPGESDEEFDETYAFLKKCNFSFLHVFPYSLRVGTKAAEMPCQVDAKVKKARAQKCISLSIDLQHSFEETWLGKKAEVIAETKQDGYTSGYTSQYIPVKIKGEYEHGTIIPIELKKIENNVVISEESVI